MIASTLFSNWHFMRIVRLLGGIFIAVQAYQTHDTLFGIMAVFFLFQAVTNTGCCGGGACATPTQKFDVSKQTEDVEFEEIK